MNEDRITLINPNGEEIEFEEIAGIALNGKFYLILQPVKLLYDMNDDEALVFEVSVDDEVQNFNIVLEDEIFDEVFKEYYRLLSETNLEEDIF